MVGARGFEPPTSASRTQRSSQAEPRPDHAFVDLTRDRQEATNSVYYILLFHFGNHLFRFFLVCSDKKTGVTAGMAEKDCLGAVGPEVPGRRAV